MKSRQDLGQMGHSLQDDLRVRVRVIGLGLGLGLGLGYPICIAPPISKASEKYSNLTAY